MRSELQDGCVASLTLFPTDMRLSSPFSVNDSHASCGGWCSQRPSCLQKLGTAAGSSVSPPHLRDTLLCCATSLVRTSFKAQVAF